MSGLAMLCGLTVLTLVLALTLQKDAPVIAFLLALAAGVLILTQVFGQMGGALQRLGVLLRQSGMTDSLYLPVAKAVGIAVVVRVLSALCRDAGRSALAAKVEIAGAVGVLSACLPLLEQVVALVSEWTI
ncbi:MAG: stage III sporulation AC/AD family protein [Agathobaculum sp.]|uniref:SpoIIIAC/SpoIIIAD family protein n=1 Tax=Agathobaculum sp. TaxID=2048138 RepID=UPI0025BCAA8F|nr:SpoIIIAC/SpoIIIAD family protein [Agathobaculum sp.]MCI7125231.1 stage III sporulation AC/AD family protein [Agathobaculum sp.]